jgi:hypothetical protein
MEDAGIFYEQLVYSCGHLVYIYRFGMLYQEKSGNPVLKSISEDERQKGNDGNFREEKSEPFSERQKLQGRNMTQRKKYILARNEDHFSAWARFVCTSQRFLFFFVPKGARKLRQD